MKRKDYKPVTIQPNKPPKHPFKVGDVVRKLTMAREKEVKLGYKRYRGEQFTTNTYTITKKRLVRGYPKYTLSDGTTAWHDALVKARKADIVKLPLFKSPKKKKQVRVPAAPTRRSTRLRGKRVDYHKVQHRYDNL